MKPLTEEQLQKFHAMDTSPSSSNKQQQDWGTREEFFTRLEAKQNQQAPEPAFSPKEPSPVKSEKRHRLRDATLNALVQGVNLFRRAQHREPVEPHHYNLNSSQEAAPHRRAASFRYKPLIYTAMALFAATLAFKGYEAVKHRAPRLPPASLAAPSPAKSGERQYMNESPPALRNATATSPFRPAPIFPSLSFFPDALVEPTYTLAQAPSESSPLANTSPSTTPSHKIIRYDLLKGTTLQGTTLIAKTQNDTLHINVPGNGAYFVNFKNPATNQELGRYYSDNGQISIPLNQLPKKPYKARLGQHEQGIPVASVRVTLDEALNSHQQETYTAAPSVLQQPQDNGTSIAALQAHDALQKLYQGNDRAIDSIAHAIEARVQQGVDRDIAAIIAVSQYHPRLDSTEALTRATLFSKGMFKARHDSALTRK